MLSHLSDYLLKRLQLLAVEETCIKTWAFNILRDWAQGKNCNERVEKQLPFHYISSNVPRFSISFPLKKNGIQKLH